jgi:hypothetical protein
MIMKRLLLCTVAILAGSCITHAATINWGHSATFRFQDENFNPVIGALVQLVYTSGGLVAPDWSNEGGGYAGANTYVMWSLESYSFFGDEGLAEGSQTYTFGSTDHTQDPPLFTTGDQFFIRVFNTTDWTDITTATHYGTSGLYTLAATQNDDVDNFYLTEDLATVTPVPEPGTMMLLGLGLLTMAVKKRKRQ